MHICYVDESGNDQVLDCYDASPVLAIVGLVISEARIKDLIWSFLHIKKAFNPQVVRDDDKLSELIRFEVKGSDLRSDLRSESRRRQRRAYGFLDAVMRALEECNATVDGEVWIKRDGAGVSQGFYPTAIATIAMNFQAQLAAADTRGLMILDARTKVKNVPSTNGITTRKFKTGGDPMPRLVESPVFGHSDAHVLLQVADIVASALVFPMACHAFCDDLENNAHPHPAYLQVRDRYGQRLRDLEHRYTDGDGARRGGILVRDKRGHGQALDLYHGPSAPSSAERRQRVRRRTRAGVDVADTAMDDLSAR